MDEHGQGQTYREETALRETMGETMEMSVKKCIPSLDNHCKAFIERSPFLCIGTSGASGRADVSPRGDPPGFVQILDDNTLFIPDRPGNNRLDTMTNIIENPNVGLIFLVPGFDDTLRVNGKATIVRDDALGARRLGQRQGAEGRDQGRNRRSLFALRQGVQALPALG